MCIRDRASIDVSGITSLDYINCQNNELTSLNLANGNNASFTYVDLTGNSDLTCIQVDDVTYSDANWSSFKDSTASYSLNCDATASIIDNQFNNSLAIYPNPVSNTLFIDLNSIEALKKATIFDLSGKEIISTTINSIDVTFLTGGVYLLKIESKAGKIAVRKVVKE